MIDKFFTGFAVVILFIAASIVCIGVIIAAITTIILMIKMWKEIFRKDE